MSLQGEIRSANVDSESGSAIRLILLSFAITLVSLFGFGEVAQAQSLGIVVNTTADHPLPDGDGGLTTLREAILNASFLCDGPCSITFNIPQTDPGYDPATGAFTIRVNPALGALPAVPPGGQIDGTSQATLSGIDSNPVGPEIVVNGSQLIGTESGFRIDSNVGATINHLVIQGFPGHGVLITGTTASSNSVINSYIGTNAQGTAAVPNAGNGIHLEGTVTDSLLSQNVVSGNGGHGIQIIGTFASSNSIINSFIGTDALGNAAVPNGGDGIHLEGTVIITAIRGNIISGNGGWGFFADVFYGDDNNNRLQANTIGASADGTSLGNGLGGAHLDSFGDSIGFPFLVLVDGVEDGTRSRPIGRGQTEQPSVGTLTHTPLLGGNVIAFNGGPGVILDAGATNNFIYGNSIYSNADEGVLLTASASAGNNITQNSIHSNGALGIDLGADGVTLNDGGSSTGPNALVDFPVITSAYFDGTNTVIEGTYQDSGVPDQVVNIEVFSNTAADPSFHGEGESWLGTTSVLTGAVANWTFTAPGDLTGQFVTATGTLFSSTSEFSEAFQVQVLDVGIVKTGPATVVAGQPLVYTLTVTNYGPITGGVVTVSDTLPIGVAFTSVSSSSNTGNTGWVCGETGGTVQCSAPAMDELEVLTVTINAVAPTTGGNITNTATVAVAPPGVDLEPANNSSSLITAVQTANLTVSKTASPEPVAASAPLIYTITVGNAGPAPASGVSLTDNLPAGVTYQGFSGAGWTCSGTTTISCSFGSPLASGASTVLTLNVLAPSTSGPITNNVSVATTTPESTTTDNTASVITTVQTANLTVSKTASPEPVDASAPLTYTITVSNSGPAAAAGISLTDNLPAGVTYQGFSGAGWTCSGTTTISCSFGSPLASGANTVLTLNVLAPSTSGPITNNVSVATTTPESTTTDNTASVITTVQTANLTVSKTASPEPVDASAPLTYTITVSNSGPAAAAGISLTDNLPAGVTYQGFSGAGWTCSGTTTITCSFGSPLASGASTVLTLNVLAPSTAGPIINNVSVATTTPESTTADNTASVQSTVNPPPADLSILKDGPGSVEPSDPISWTVTVTNLGPGTALSVSVVDTLPSSVVFGSVAPPAGWTCSENLGVVTCTTASMAPSASAAIVITATAPATEGTVTNTASVTASGVDSSPANNSSSKTTTVDSLCPSGSPVPVTPAYGSTESDSEVTFSWKAVAGAVAYEVILVPEGGTPEVVGTFNGSAPAGQTLSLVGQAQPGLNIWTVRASFGNSCPPSESVEFRFFVRSCPTGAPVPISPITGVTSESPVVFRWTGVSGGIRYDLYAAINSAPFALVDSIDSDGSGGEFMSTLGVNPGSTVSWFVEAHFADNCPPTASEVVGFESDCFPPIPSVVGEVTSGKPYEVRATIGTTADQYEFQEALDPLFENIVDTKLATSVPGAEYVAAIFEHLTETPIRYHYRARILNENNCPFSPPASTAVIPIPDPASFDTDIVVQFGVEEPVTQQILIPSPDPASGLSFTFTAATDRDWLTVSPAAGTMGPEGVLFTVVSNPEGLPVGTNTGTVMVTFTALASGKSALNGVGTTTSVPVSVSLVTPVTNRGKDSPVAQSLIIPAVAHVDGVGAKWRTDARLVNLGLSPERYFLNFTSSQEDGTRSGKSAEIRLSPGQTTALDDMVKHWYGLGSIAGEGATGVLEIRPLSFSGKTGDALVTKTLVSVASSRTYAKSGLATMGQFIPALPFSVFVGSQQPEQPRSVLSLQQLAQTSAFRTNLGLVEASGKSAAVEIRFFDAAGDSLVTVPVALQAGEHRQFNQILAQNGFTNLPIGRAEVEVMSGEGRITAYASVVDNATSDPLLVEAVNLGNLGASRYVVPGIAHLETGAARWRSDMQIFNAGNASVRATLQFFRTGESTAAATQQIDLQPGTITSLENVVALFGESNVGGAVQVTTDSASQLVVTARTFDQQENGTVGQFIPAVTSEDAIGLGDRGIQVLQMEESPNIRSNLGVVEVTGQAVTLEISAFAAESRTTPRVQVQLKPNEFRQFNQVLRALNVGNTYNARLAVRVVGGQGRIAAYGSAVDNRTQDPTYVPGQ